MESNTEQKEANIDNVSQMFDGKCVGLESRKVHRGMTDMELLSAKDRFCQLQAQISDYEAEKASAKAHFDAKIKPLQQDADELLLEIRAQEFTTQEDCYILHDYAQNKVKYISSVTMEIVYVRDMTGSDRQMAIDFEQKRQGNDEENKIPRGNE